MASLMDSDLYFYLAWTCRDQAMSGAVHAPVPHGVHTTRQNITRTSPHRQVFIAFLLYCGFDDRNPLLSCWHVTMRVMRALLNSPLIPAPHLDPNNWKAVRLQPFQPLPRLISFTFTAYGTSRWIRWYWLLSDVEQRFRATRNS